MHLAQIILAVSLTGHAWSADMSMAGVAFLWPPDRAWSAENDNTAPCGSAQGVVNRTDFPTSNGAIALVAQDESWNIQVAVSYNNNPTSNDDFKTVISDLTFTEMKPGHRCLLLPNPDARSISNNDGNATIQIKYTSDLYDNKNETYYACADIRYVSPSEFHTHIPCFNTTADDTAESSGGNRTRSGKESGAGVISAPSLVWTLLVAVVALAVGV